MDTFVAPRAAFAHRNFRHYLVSRLFANLGVEMLGIAVGWQVYSMTHRAIDLGYLGLAQFVPAFGLSLVAGNVADRFDRGLILAISSIGLAVCVGGLLSLSVAATTRVAPIYVVLIFVGALRAFDAPAAQALVPGLVPSEHFPNAVTWAATLWQVSTIAGPALGGVLYGVTGSAVSVYGVCIVFLAIASSFALLVRARTTPSVASERATWSRALAGLRFVRAHPVIFESVSLDLFAVLLGGATALLPMYASDILHVGPAGLGMLRSAPAVGAAAMAIALVYRPLKRRSGPTMLASVGLFGLATIVFGLSRDVTLSIAALVVLGASDMISVVVRGTVVQLRTPDDMRGRVSAVSMMFVATSSNLGELESGMTAAWLGAVPAVVIGGLGTLVVVAIYTLCFPALRGVDRLDGAG